jgi:type VI secretion system protein ImpC
MSRPWSLKIGDLALGTAPAGAEEVPVDAPFRIGILGTFRPRLGLDVPRSAAQRPVRVDRDNFHDVLARAGVEIRLPPEPTSPTGISIRIQELDDFHPDRLFRSLAVFSPLRELRQRLVNPSTFAAAAAEVRGWSASPTPPPKPDSSRQTPPPSPAGMDSKDLLEQVLGGALPAEPRTGQGRGQAPSGLTEFLRQIVAPYAVPGADPDQGTLIAQVDAAISAQMRGILHHPAFQEAEAAWRSVFFLVSRLETSSNLQLFLLDLSRAELAADLEAEPFAKTSTFKLLVEQAVGTAISQPWAVLVGNYTFEQSPADVRLLARLAQVARHAGAPFLAAGHSRILGCPSLAESPDPDDWHEPSDPEAAKAWATLRRLPETAYLGLALPRFLLRLPYGKEVMPAEEFAFEEMPAVPRHDWYLWGNPAFACALLLGESYREQGWDMRPGDVLEIDGLPLHVYKEAGESRLKPPAEVLLRERGTEIILDTGVMPLLSLPEQDVIRLARFQSLADPPGPLAGKWQ